MSHSEIGGDKRISQHLSVRERPGLPACQGQFPMNRADEFRATCRIFGLVKKLSTLVAELKLDPPSCPGPRDLENVCSLTTARRRMYKPSSLRVVTSSIDGSERPPETRREGKSRWSSLSHRDGRGEKPWTPPRVSKANFRTNLILDLVDLGEVYRWKGNERIVWQSPR